MIRFKVTTLDDKSCVTSYKYKNSKFTLLYKDNTIIEADKNTVGFILFKTRTIAQRFIDDYRCSCYESWKIKRVVPLDRGKVPRYLAYIESLYNFYTEMKKYGVSRTVYSAPPPMGNICHYKIKVLGDCK